MQGMSIWAGVAAITAGLAYTAYSNADLVLSHIRAA